VKSSVLDVASSVTNALSRLHVASGIAIELAISGVDIVAVDAQDLGEILGCVIDNAFKHAESCVRVTSLADNDQTIELRIEDDGTGLPPESRDYVFQSGARVNENVDGSGLGLAIVKEIVELYRGHCLFSDSDLGGAMLSIWLPRA
jgi:signal transduction histidine kinase